MHQSYRQARERDWRGMSEKGLAWYTNPAPGKPRSENQADFEKPSPDPQDPVLPTFGLVTLDVLEVSPSFSSKCLSAWVLQSVCNFHREICLNGGNVRVACAPS